MYMAKSTLRPLTAGWWYSGMMEAEELMVRNEKVEKKQDM
jgi:hypothetical protein